MEHITIPLLPSPKHRQTVNDNDQSIHQSIRLIDSRKRLLSIDPSRYSRSEAVPLAGLGGGRAIDRLTDLEQTPLWCFSLYYPWSHRRIGPGPRRAPTDVPPVVVSKQSVSVTHATPIPPRFGISGTPEARNSESSGGWKNKGFRASGLAGWPAKSDHSVPSIFLAVFQKGKQEQNRNGFMQGLWRSRS